jgi:hypothetical protein
VGGTVGEQDAPAAGRDQQQRRRQHVEQRLVPAAAGDLSPLLLEPLDGLSLCELICQSLHLAKRKYVGDTLTT